LFNDGIFAIKTLLEPGAHGATVAGTHGIGVNTPMAAVVAEATTGFDSEEHVPKGGIFTTGILSIILAAGILQVITLFFGNTINEPGAAPKEQDIIAPIHTCCGMVV